RTPPAPLPRTITTCHSELYADDPDDYRDRHEARNLLAKCIFPGQQCFQDSILQQYFLSCIQLSLYLQNMISHF
ncbi:MAG: hypothetical protein K9I94_13540, partial [Bacteroidales bacterium]|nr:hypothetical protein [Bacteroidales bacterium]